MIRVPILDPSESDPERADYRTMAKAPSRNVQHRGAHQRAGEGHYVDFNLEPVQGVSGIAARFKASIGDVPVPDRRYSADTCSVLAKHGALMLLFGQERVVGAGLRNLLVVNMTKAYAAGMVRMADQINGPTLAEVFRQVGIEPEQSELPAEEPASTVSLNAAVAIVAIDDQASSIDFMQISPFAKHAARASSQIAVDPVVRIELRASLLFGLIEALREVTQGVLEPEGDES